MSMTLSMQIVTNAISPAFEVDPIRSLACE